MSDLQTKNWYKTLIDKTHSLSEEFGLDDVQTNRFRDFTISVAKEHYKVGNKSGIAWLHKQMREQTQQPLATKETP